MTAVDTDRVEVFEANRPRLFGLAYRMLGEASEAEDVVQDAYLRWATSDDVAVPEAWLTKVVTNLCLNRLTSARARRETYVGPWLPEPVVTSDGALGPLDTVERRDSVSAVVEHFSTTVQPRPRWALHSAPARLAASATRAASSGLSGTENETYVPRPPPVGRP
jgi:DNA-directed RNA polymerase specialized sigma24 family protein